MIKRLVVLFLSVILASFSVSIILRSAIGVGAWLAFSQTFATVIDVKVGTFSMIMNITCVLGQIMIKKEINIKLILQVFLAVILGNMINLFYYELFENWIIDTYAMKLLLYMLATLLIAFGIGTVTAQNFINFPLESLCMEISKKTNRPFGKIRQFVDIITIIAVLFLVLFFDGLMTIREGTIIGMVIFGPLLDLYMRFIKPLMIGWKVFDNV